MDIQKSLKNPNSFWIAERIIFFGTLISFLVFTGLLMITERHNVAAAGQHFLNYLFNIVSVGTLTGLFQGDSGTLTFNGQLVLLLDMVVNGLIASVVSILLIIFVRLGFGRKETLRLEIEKIGAHTKSILAFILLDFLFVWGLGTLLLLASGAHGLWEAVFNSASHILNDGVTALPNNMIPYARNVPMLLSGAFLITIGGLGISIRGYVYKQIFRLFRLHKLAESIPDSILAPKNFIVIVLLVTLGLQVFGAFSLYALEHSNMHIFAESTSSFVKFINSYYMSVSARTAGFTTFQNLALLNDKSNLVLMGLMAVGAAPGSFAGGIFKITAFIYVLVSVSARFLGYKEVRTPHRRLHFAERTIMEADLRVIGFSLVVMILIVSLFFVQPNISGFWLMFEGISAVSNTGLTLGATGVLNSMAMIIIITLMTIGKIGFIATVTSFFPRFRHMIERADTNFDALPVD
ncbi:MAG TPA: potassium transporter TrkG [Patescibacteria group bacterium]|jgi:trk system potassium uptake protein TrkH|nr:potassium transporter TrkG [Patescibacteria group bacterium]